MAKKCGENDVQPEKIEVICYGSLSRYVDPKIRPVHSRHHLAALALAWIDIFLFLATGWWKDFYVAIMLDFVFESCKQQ